jgi:hypothetical protein
MVECRRSLQSVRTWEKPAKAAERAFLARSMIKDERVHMEEDGPPKGERALSE